MKEWCVYILCCADNTLYTGITNDLDKRITKHNAGKGAKYTKTRRPVKLLQSIVVADKSQALRLEYKIKQLPKKDKLKPIDKYYLLEIRVCEYCGKETRITTAGCDHCDVEDK